jgi:hypothetical protein
MPGDCQMIFHLKKLWGDQSGSALAIAAAAMPLMIGAAGLATDTIQWTLWKRQLQRAADSAAIAGVYERIKNDTTTDVENAVDNDLDLNDHTNIPLLAGFPDVDLLADDGDATDRVQVALEIQKSLAFSAMFMASAPIIRADAIAASVPGTDEYCVVSLETSASKTGITIGGNSSIDMDCGFISNSPAANSAINKGTASTVNASVIAAKGGVQASSNWTVDKYDPYVSAVEDPYASIDPDASEMSGCAANPQSLTASSPTSLYSGSAVCVGSITVGSGDTLDLGSNKTIYVTGQNQNSAGNITLHGKLKCSQCTIILTNKDSSTTAKIGTFDMQANGLLEITAPATGKYKGLAVFQDRRATDTNGASAPNTFNGGGAQVIEGALYFPSQAITYSGNGTATAVCTRFVARRVEFTGTSSSVNRFEKGSNCGAVGLDPIGGGRRIRLVA